MAERALRTAERNCLGQNLIPLRSLQSFSFEASALVKRKPTLNGLLEIRMVLISLGAGKRSLCWNGPLVSVPAGRVHGCFSSAKPFGCKEKEGETH